MSSPMVESRNNPDTETGFPFDDDHGDRFRRLDDLASRFPEFADHLNSFQSTSRPRRTSGPGDSWSDYDTFNIFPSRLHSRFQDAAQPHPQTQPHFAPQQQQQQQQQQPPPPPRPQQQQQQQPPPAEAPKQTVIPENKGDSVDGTQQRANIQQSNTVDLGQKQDPVDDNRNQRSMSAPPENRPNLFGRFVSSINIPNLNPEPDMGSRMSSQAEQSSQQKPPTERIIPIHIEGRDEPIAPKNVQTETIFGQKPTQFTQFLNREPNKEEINKQYQAQEEEYRKQQQEAFQKQQQQVPPPQHQPQEHSEPPKKPTPLDLIQNIQKDVNALMSQVEKFAGQPKDKQYLYLDEMLTRNLLKLDNIETEGKDTIRQARKMAIKCIEECIKVLETKASNNVVAKVEDTPDAEEQPKPEVQEQPIEKPAESEAIPAPPPTEPENMEVEKLEQKPDDVVKEEPVADEKEPKTEEPPKTEEEQPKLEVNKVEETQSSEKKKVKKKVDKK